MLCSCTNEGCLPYLLALPSMYVMIFVSIPWLYIRLGMNETNIHVSVIYYINIRFAKLSQYKNKYEDFII